MDIRDVFATNVRRLRAERSLSQDDLAYDAGVSRSYLSQIEKGRGSNNEGYFASLSVVERLAKTLGVEPAALLAATPRPKRSKS